MITLKIQLKKRKNKKKNKKKQKLDKSSKLEALVQEEKENKGSLEEMNEYLVDNLDDDNLNPGKSFEKKESKLKFKEMKKQRKKDMKQRVKGVKELKKKNKSR